MTARRRGRQRARERERGAILVFTGVVLTALLAFTAIAIDLGYQRVARRDMQALADVVALDLVRRVDGSTVDQLLAAGFEAAKDQSVARNDDVQGHDLEVVAELGVLDANRTFTAVSGTAVPNAVKVTATSSTKRFFAPTADGTVSRSAIAGGDEERACFSIGSYALELGSGNSALLNSLVGDALNLGVLGYDGLVTSEVTLLELMDAYADLNLGTAEELLTSEVALGDFYLAVAEALRRKGDTANANLLQNSIAANVGALPPIHLADIVTVDPTDEAALASTFNVLDLVTGAAFVSNGQNLLSLPNVTTDFGIIQLGASARIVERPRSACGRAAPTTRAETSQIHVEAGDPDLLNINLPIPLVGGVSIVGGLTLTLDNAQGVGVLQDVLCGATKGMDIQVATALLQAGVDIPVRIRGNVTLVGLIGLVSVDIRVTFHAGTNPPATSMLIPFRFPPDQYEVFKPAGAGTVGLAGFGVSRTGLSVEARLLAIPITLNATQLGQILDPIVANVVNPIIQDLDDALLGPISELLGLNVAGADVAAIRPEVRCTGNLALVG